MERRFVIREVGECGLHLIYLMCSRRCNAALRKAPSAGSKKETWPGSRSRSDATTTESPLLPPDQPMKSERSRNVPKPDSQKMIFAPNCNCRGLLAVLFALPKLDAFEMSLPGVPRITVLNRLKDSARNSLA